MCQFAAPLSKYCSLGSTKSADDSQEDRFISPSTMRTQNLAAPHGPKSVAFHEFIAAGGSLIKSIISTST
eukprot:scaffold10013_cov79-Skeletonema_dohrnii-CCMP3373.AAC.27